MTCTGQQKARSTETCRNRNMQRRSEKHSRKREREWEGGGGWGVMTCGVALGWKKVEKRWRKYCLEVQGTRAEEKWRTWDQVQRTGSSPVEPMAAGQISVTPKSSLLQSTKEEGRGAEQGRNRLLTHPFYRGHQRYTSTQMHWLTLVFHSNRQQEFPKHCQNVKIYNKYFTAQTTTAAKHTHIPAIVSSGGANSLVTHAAAADEWKSAQIQNVCVAAPAQHARIHIRELRTHEDQLD